MKNFVAPDMRTALRMVREELGDDAVILANRRVAAGVELLAAAEMPPAPVPIPSRQSTPAPVAPEPDAGAAATVVETPAPRRTDAAAARAYAGAAFAELAQQPAAGGDAAWWQMQQELRSMRDLIEQQISGFAWQQYRSQRPADAAMWRRLQRLGLDGETIAELLEQGGSEGSARGNGNARANWQQLMARLSAMLPVVEQDPVAAGGVFAFVGPTGVGKTTTIGKLAARHVLEHGNSQVALVTLDSFRIGAHEQLRTLARILNVPMKVAATPKDLGSILYELRGHRLVLIDTAGLGAQSPALREQLGALDGLGERVQVLQVLAVNSQRQVLQAAQRSYRTGNTIGCIFTKLDEAGSLGEALGLAIRSRLPLAYVTDGQAIPGDLARAQGKALVSRAINLAKQVEVDEQRLAAAFAARAPQSPQSALG